MKWLIAIESSNSHLSLFISAKSLLRVKNWLKCIKDFFSSLTNSLPNIFCLVASLPDCVYCMIKEEKNNESLHCGVIFHQSSCMVNSLFINRENMLATFQLCCSLKCCYSPWAINFSWELLVAALNAFKSIEGQKASLHIAFVFSFKM